MKDVPFLPTRVLTYLTRLRVPGQDSSRNPNRIKRRQWQKFKNYYKLLSRDGQLKRDPGRLSPERVVTNKLHTTHLLNRKSLIGSLVFFGHVVKVSRSRCGSRLLLQDLELGLDLRQNIPYFVNRPEFPQLYKILHLLIFIKQRSPV